MNILFLKEKMLALHNFNRGSIFLVGLGLILISMTFDSLHTIQDILSGYLKLLFLKIFFSNKNM